jgi:hypothetical protein
MKQYGRRRQHPGNLPDNHPGKGYVNWWEGPEDSNKGRVRMEGKELVRFEVDEYQRQRNRNALEEICRNCDGLLCRQGLCRIFPGG